MKLLLFVSLVILLSFTSCNKMKDPNATILNKTRWEWQESWSGGVITHITTPTAGTSVQLEFNSNFRYQVKVNTVLTSEGSYYVITDDNTQKVTLDNFTPSSGLYLLPVEILTIRDSTLVLHDDQSSNGSLHEFVKVK